MSYHTLKMNILDKHLCTSCGLCVSVCPEKFLELNDSNIPTPVHSQKSGNPLGCINCGLCERVCAGYDTGSCDSEFNLYGRQRDSKERWVGIYKNCYQMMARESSILQRAGSGGAGTVLAMTALKEGIAEAMIVIGRDTQRPWVPKAVLVSSPEKLPEYAQTTYCITPNLHFLDQCHYEKIGVIGLPCQIQGLRKLMRIQNSKSAEKLARKISLLIELACSSNTLLQGTEHIITSLMQIPLNDVTELRYRNGNYPGDLMVKTCDGQMHTFPFFRAVEEFKRFKTYRCSTCPDWWSGLADISISDGNPNVFALSKNHTEALPVSTVVVRTALGQRLVNLAYRNQMIALREYHFENNLGLERKRQRYRCYMSRTDSVIPRAPSEDVPYEDILSDEEVLEYGIEAENSVSASCAP